jgi:hypothetical protein
MRQLVQDLKAEAKRLVSGGRSGLRQMSERKMSPAAMKRRA